MYFPRESELFLKEYASFSRAVLVTGARQVGKSTLLKHCFPDARHIVLDPVLDPFGIRTDPELFLDTNPPPGPAIP